MGFEAYTAEYGKQEVHGWVRHFNYKWWDYAGILMYVFALFWGLEFITSIIHFIIAYAVSIWYFTPCLNDGEYSKPPIPGTIGMEGFGKAVRYHLGSLSFGACLVAAF